MDLNRREVSPPACQLPKASSWNTSGLRVSKRHSTCSTYNHIPLRIDNLRRYRKLSLRTVRPTRIQKGERPVKKLPPRRSVQWLKTLQDWAIAQEARQKDFHELPSYRSERGAFIPQTTEIQQQVSQKPEVKSLPIPYENFVGSMLGGLFQLQNLRFQEDHLDIYLVTTLNGVPFEAQAFSFTGLSAKLLQARKRRMKRLRQSKHFVYEIEQAGKKYLIIDVERSEAEWRNLGHKIDRHGSDSTNRDSSCQEDFPNLSAARCRRESFSSDCTTEADTSSIFSSRPPSSLDSRSSSMSSSYAEVASKGLEYDQGSKTRKGIRQRQRRQRKRKGEMKDPQAKKC